MTQRLCAHDSNPAIAICSGCGEDICGLCHRATLTGYALCVVCARKIDAALSPAWERAHTFGELLMAFPITAVAVLSSARAVFSILPARGPVLRSLTFGTLAYMIGAYATLLWQWAFVDSFPEFVADFAARVSVSEDAAFGTLLAVLPLGSVFAVALQVVLLHLSLRIFGARAHWSVTARIVGYASASYLLQIIPPIAQFPIGHTLSVVWLVNVQMIAVRYTFDLGIWKAMAAVFVPFVALILIGV